MSVLIIGGNECMVCQYEKICREHGCRAKIFVKEKGCIKKKMGCPDLMIIFTSTVSHKMANSAVAEARRNGVRVERIHSSSCAALEGALRDFRKQNGKPAVSA